MKEVGCFKIKLKVLRNKFFEERILRRIHANLIARRKTTEDAFNVDYDFNFNENNKNGSLVPPEQPRSILKKVLNIPFRLKGRAKSVGFISVKENNKNETKTCKPLPALIPISKFRQNPPTSPKQPSIASQIVMNLFESPCSSNNDQNIESTWGNNEDFGRLYWEDDEF